MTAWPDWVSIIADGVESGAEPNVERTPFDDGAIAQEKTRAQATRTLGVTVLIDDDDDYARFDTWAATHSHEYFDWTSPIDGRALRARVRGGHGGIRYRSVIIPGPKRTWEARLELEGPALL